MTQGTPENKGLTQRLELQKFYDKLERADWYYDFSDDGRVWRAGAAAFV